jgi:hypothetical protein
MPLKPWGKRPLGHHSIYVQHRKVRLQSNLLIINNIISISSGAIMSQMEQLELNAYRNEIVSDMEALLEKYRAIFNWDIPEIDEAAADKLILAAMHAALDGISQKRSV